MLNPFESGSARHERRIREGSPTEGDADALLYKAVRGGELTEEERAALEQHYPGILERDEPTRH